MIGNGYEKIDISDLKGNNPNSQRIFQKLFFGKEFLDNDFFNLEKIEGTNIHYLNVKQLEQNTRMVIIEDSLYKFTPENPLYNYLDNGRAVFCGSQRYFIFNDPNISREDLKVVDTWHSDKREINFKQIWETPINDRSYHNPNKQVYLLFKEDIERIKAEVLREQEEERLEEIRDKKELTEEEQKKKEQEKKITEMRKNFMTYPRIEDRDIIIEGNYFIEKDKGLKIAFDKKVIDIFGKEDLFNDYYIDSENFISLGYSDFLWDLAREYYIGKHKTSLEEKIKKINLSHKKYWLQFKVYAYNLENKTEEFLTEIKIENKYRKGKYKFFINNVLIPKQKMTFALNFLGGYSLNYGSLEPEVLKNRLRNINTSLEQIKYHSGTQLRLLEGKILEVVYNNVKIPLQFEISNPDFDKDNWQVNFNGFKINKKYNDVKQALHYGNYSNIVSGITKLTEFLGNKIEDKVIDYVKVYIEKRKQAEQRARQLFLDFIAKNNSRIIAKDNFYIVKGKLKNYKLAFKNDNDVGAWTYPNENYVCINERDRKGNELVGYDKMLQFALALMNDSGMRDEISTLDR